ncbi:30S ribosomal protein S13 [Candidatus Woesebacteria bacterium]|nr:30S ribosomal protein S13 [Candidatus Woesebacteria bacterium]
MPRIVGVDIPEHKKVYFALQAIFGVGPKIAKDVVRETQINPDKRARELTTDEINRIQRVLEKYLVEGDLRRDVNDAIDRLKRIRSYRGYRHMAHLPARGQRTRSNGRTARGGGRRKTVGAMTKEMAAKLETAKSTK